jgi:NADPH2:quinone reductase
MKAAVLREYGVPRYEDFEDPPAGERQTIVEVLAAGVNPVDISIAAARFYAGAPPLPCVAGREGIGRLEGERVYFDAPVWPYGSIAERALIDPVFAHPVPDSVADGLAVALGISGLAAWLALSWRAKLEPGEHVLVLGAGGIVGQIAVQMAKHRGAARVVAASRSEESLERARALGADAGVSLLASDELSSAMAQAAEGRIDVVIDPLFGEPFAAAVQAASYGARLVQLGTSAGAEATLPSAPIRGKMLQIMGHTNVGAPLATRHAAYQELLDAAAQGAVSVEVQPLALQRVAEAWELVAGGAHRKIVLVP